MFEKLRNLRVSIHKIIFITGLFVLPVESKIVVEIKVQIVIKLTTPLHSNVIFKSNFVRILYFLVI